jgi:hypothetical protein
VKLLKAKKTYKGKWSNPLTWFSFGWEVRKYKGEDK